ncbi:copper resistance protein CopC [Acidobacteria bacterium AH-259-D05]|nr:copper resistance protein CopC [Acidobacteria bacterium AH-259-D05]
MNGWGLPTVRRFVRTGIAGLAFTLVTVGLMGHATLLNTVPPANARLEESPQKVELHFNEGIEPIFNAVMVLNRNGLPVHKDRATLSRNRRVMSIELREDLPQGIYTVTWRATSSDGHQIGGNFGFSMGEEFQASAMVTGEADDQGNWPDAGMAINRWFYLIAMMMFVGGFTFGAVILLPLVKHPSLEASSEVSSEVRRVFLRFFSWSWVVLLITAILNILFKAAAMADSTLLEAVNWGILSSVVSMSQYGRMWGVGMVLILCSGILFWLYRRIWSSPQDSSKGRIVLYVGAALGAVLLFTISNSGHAAAVTEWRAVALGTDALHLLATAMWVGGLIYLILLMRSLSTAEPEVRARLLGEAVPRFSRMAQFCVLVIILTGAYTAWIHMPSWSSFVTTWYGLALLTKILLVLPLLAIGGINLLVIKPQLRKHLIEQGERALEGAIGILRRFRPLVQAEVVLGVLILLVVTLLTNLPPAATAVGPAGPNLVSNRSDFEVTLNIEPNQIGHNQVEVQVKDKQGNTIGDLDTVFLDVRMTDMDMPSQRIEATVGPDSSYQAEAVLGMGGMWRFNVRVMAKGSSEQQTIVFDNYLP